MPSFLLIQKHKNMTLLKKVVQKAGGLIQSGAKVGLGLAGKALPGALGIGATALSKIIPEPKKKAIEAAVKKAGVIDQKKLVETIKTEAKGSKEMVSVSNDDLHAYLDNLTKDLKKTTGVTKVTEAEPVTASQLTASMPDGASVTLNNATTSKTTNMMFIVIGAIIVYYLISKK